MKRFLSRFCGAALAVSLALTGLSAPAAAAGTISVTLDDQPMAFTDARPLMRDSRTFVPFRAIFEGMGASVGWDQTTRTVTAQRGDRTVKLTIGRKAVTVDRAGADRSFSTDAAPFIEGGRTYVPIRFAAQALGAAVGWDNPTQTVLLVDTEAMMQNSEFNGQFSTLSDMLAFAAANAPVSPRAVTGMLTGKLTFHTAMGDIPVVLNGNLAGAESLDAAQFTGTVACDRTAIEAAITMNEGQNVIGDEVDSLLKKLENLSLEAILSRVDGKLYLKSDALTEIGIPAGTWAMKDLDMTDSLTAVKNQDAIDFVCARAQQLDLKLGSSAHAVRQVVLGLSDLAAGRPDLDDPAVVSLGLSDGTDDLLLTLTPGESLEAKRRTDTAALTTTQRADGTTLTLTEERDGCTTDVRLDLVNAGAASAPAVRPAS